MSPEIFKPLGGDKLALPVSSLDDPVWQLAEGELNLVVKGRSPGYGGGDSYIWVSIEERNVYCDRGHYLVKMHCGDQALCIDAADCRPNYYMHMEVAKSETIEWLRWRIKGVRAENFGGIRSLEAEVDEIVPDDDPVVQVTKCPGGGESWYYAFRRSGRLAGAAHELKADDVASLRAMLDKNPNQEERYANANDC